MSEQTKERGEKVSPIQALADRAQDLGRSIDNWNAAYIVLGAFTVALAFGVFIAQLEIIRKGKLLTAVQSDLITEKDRQSSADSKDKDLKIAAALSSAGSANERAGLANERAGKLESANLALKADLERATAESRQKQTQLEVEQRKTAEAQKAAAEAQRAVNEAIVGRLFAREPRINLPEILKAYPPGKAEIWYRDSDPEPWIFAGSIRNALAIAGWDISGELKPIPANRFDGKDLPVWGVTVFNKHREGVFTQAPPADAALIAKFLGANGNTDMRLAALVAALASTLKKDESLGEDEFRILVGPRDPTNF